MKRNRLLSLPQIVMTTPGLGGPTSANIFLLRAEFDTPAAAPLGSSIAVDVGTLLIGDPNAKISVTGGNMTVATGGTVDTTGVTDSRIRPLQSGLAMIVVGYKEATGGTSYIGWNTTGLVGLASNFRGTLQPGFYRGMGVSAASVAIPASVDSTARDYVFVRAANGDHWVFRDYHLIMIERAANISPLWPTPIHCSATTVTPLMSAVRIRALPLPWSLTEGIAWVNAAAVSNTNNALAPADGFHEVLFAQPAVPVLNDKLELRVRVADTSNYISVYLLWNGSQWNLELWKDVAGVLTQIGSTVTNVGTVTSIFLQIVSTAVTVWTRASATDKGTRRIAGAAVPSSSQVSSTPVVVQGSWTLGNIYAYSDTALPDSTTYSASLGAAFA